MENKERNYYFSNGNLATQPLRQPKRKVIKKRKIVRKVNYDALKSKLTYLVFVAYVFSLGMLYVLGSSIINTKQMTMESLQTELNNITKENLMLTEQLEAINDLDYIFTKATEELGMINPETDQVKYITLAKVSYSKPLQSIGESNHRINITYNP